MNKHTRAITRMIDKMMKAGWIARSVSRDEGGTIEWTDGGRSAMKVLHHLMFESLQLQPGEEGVFAWMVSDFPQGQKRGAKRRGGRPPSQGPDTSA
jgi:hypothetical protein